MLLYLTTVITAVAFPVTDLLLYMYYQHNLQLEEITAINPSLWLNTPCLCNCPKWILILLPMPIVIWRCSICSQSDHCWMAQRRLSVIKLSSCSVVHLFIYLFIYFYFFCFSNICVCVCSDILGYNSCYCGQKRPYSNRRCATGYSYNYITCPAFRFALRYLYLVNRFSQVLLPLLS